MNLKISEPCEDVQVPEKVESSEPPSGDGSLQQAGIAPETPVRQSSSRRPFESPKASKEIRLESPYDSVTLEKEPLAEEDHGLDFALMHEVSFMMFYLFLFYYLTIFLREIHILL